MSHPTELRRGGLWAGWQITGHSCCHGDCCSWRRWITHQRSSVNHQSPLTSHYRHRHPPLFFTDTHTYTHTLEEDAAQNLTGRDLLTSQLKLCENTAPSDILHLSVFQPSSFSSRSSLITPTYHSTCHFSASLLFCHLLLSPLSPLLCFPFLFIPASSKSHSSSPPHCALYHSGISVSCVSLGISLPSTTEQANHCWHFKRHWIKWPTVGWVCGSTICSMTSTSQ